MYPFIFFSLGVVFSWLLFNGYTTGEILARGWGSEIRRYSRDEQPFAYWATFLMYAAIVIVCFTLSTLLALKKSA